jgi:hypothetical protein
MHNFIECWIKNIKGPHNFVLGVFGSAKIFSTASKKELELVESHICMQLVPRGKMRHSHQRLGHAIFGTQTPLCTFYTTHCLEAPLSIVVLALCSSSPS